MSITTANQTIVGACSICGGPVCVPTAYHSTVPPVPKCADCGASAKRNYGAIIEMEPARRTDVRWSGLQYDSGTPTKWPSKITVDCRGGRNYEYSLNPDQISGTWEVPSEQQPGST